MTGTLDNFPDGFEAVKNHDGPLLSSLPQGDCSTDARHTQRISISQRRQDFLRTVAKRIGPHNRQNFAF